MKMVKSIEDSGLLFKRVSETTQNVTKEQKGQFLSLLKNVLTGKGINRAGEKIIRAGYGSQDF